MQDSAPEDQPCPQGPGRPELTRACRAPPGLGFLLTSKVARASRLKVTRGRGDLWGCVGTPPTSDASLMHAAACRQYLPRTSLERLRQLSVASGTAASLYSFRALQNLSQGSLTRTRIGPLALLLGKGKPATRDRFLVPPLHETELLKQVSATCCTFCTCSPPLQGRVQVLFFCMPGILPLQCDHGPWNVCHSVPAWHRLSVVEPWNATRGRRSP